MNVRDTEHIKVLALQFLKKDSKVWPLRLQVFQIKNMEWFYTMKQLNIKGRRILRTN